MVGKVTKEERASVVGRLVALHASKTMGLKLGEGMDGEGKDRGIEHHQNTVDPR